MGYATYTLDISETFVGHLIWSYARSARRIARGIRAGR